MANTGMKQATVAYKVSRPGGIPLDIDGVPISVSGKRQAIRLLSGGYANPNPSLYEVEGYFGTGDVLTGNPTQIYDPTACPVGYIKITPASVVLSPAAVTGVFMLESLNPWVFVSGPNIATVSPTSGANGIYTITATRTANLGQGTFIFRDPLTGLTASIYIVNASDPNIWILQSGTWNMLGFWLENGVWNYS